MYKIIYAFPLIYYCFAVLFLLIGWVLTESVAPLKIIRKPINISLLCVGGIVIFWATLYRAPARETFIRLTPFYSLYKAHSDPDYGRNFLLNIFLFIPLCLGIAGLLPKEKVLIKRMMTVVCIGFCLSISIEILQLVFSVGDTELDDVICNTLGACIAALVRFVSEKISECQKSGGEAVDN